MARKISVSFSDHFSRFIDERVRTGHYSSASDVVRAGLRLLEEHEAKLAALQAALIEGEQSGLARAFDFDQFMADKLADRDA